MCRTLHCRIMMAGMNGRISMDDLMAALQQRFGGSTGEEQTEQTQEQFIRDAIARVTSEIRASEIVLKLLESEPPEEGAKLSGLLTMAPKDPAKHGVLTVVTYALEGGSYLVVGTDHLTQFKTEHTTPNEHGVDALVHATEIELANRSVKAAEAEEEAEAHPS